MEEKLKITVIIVWLSFPIWGSIMGYMFTTNSCRYQLSKEWLVNCKKIIQYTGDIESVIAPLTITGYSVNAQYPNVVGDASIVIKVKGSKNDAYVQVVLRQDGKKERSIIHYNVYKYEYWPIPYDVIYNDLLEENFVFGETLDTAIKIDCSATPIYLVEQHSVLNAQ